MNPGSVFISHSSSKPDFETALWLAHAFERAGLDVWWDSERLAGGVSFPEEIQNAIGRQHFFLFIVSENSIASKWCKRELSTADSQNKKIIPLKLGDVPPEDRPIQLQNLTEIDLSKGLDNALPKILGALGASSPRPAGPSDDPFARDGRLVAAAIEALNYGGTFTNALNLVQLLSTFCRKCCATKRADALFAGMLDQNHFAGHRIDYRRVASYLERGWAGE